MFDWLFETKIQNVSKAVHERTDKIISILTKLDIDFKKTKSYCILYICLLSKCKLTNDILLYFL